MTFKRVWALFFLQTHSLVLSWIACTDSTVTPRIYSKHEERCDSPAAPQAKALDPYVNSTGSLTPVLHLERKAEFHVSTWDEGWLPCWNSIGTPRAMSDLERSTEVPASTQGGPRPLHRLERNPKKPLTTQMEAWLFTGKTSGSLRSPLELERNPKFPATTREKPGDSPLNARWGPFPLQHLREITFPLEPRKGTWHLLWTQEVPWYTRLHSRGTPSIPTKLKNRPVFPSSSRDEGPFPASSAKESRRSRCTSRGGRSHPETPEELQGSFHNSKRPWCPCPLKIRPYSPATTQMRSQVSTHNTKEGLRAPWHL